MEFLLEDYSNCKEDDFSDVQVRLVNLEEMFEEITKAHNDKTRKIAIYPLGKCLLDWTADR